MECGGMCNKTHMCQEPRTINKLLTHSSLIVHLKVCEAPLSVNFETFYKFSFPFEKVSFRIQVRSTTFLLSLCTFTFPRKPWQLCA